MTGAPHAKPNCLARRRAAVYAIGHGRHASSIIANAGRPITPAVSSAFSAVIRRPRLRLDQLRACHEKAPRHKKAAGSGVGVGTQGEAESQGQARPND